MVTALGHFLAARIGEIFFVVGELLKQFAQARGRWIDRQLAGEKRNRLRELSTAITSMFSTTAASAALLFGTMMPRNVEWAMPTLLTLVLDDEL